VVRPQEEPVIHPIQNAAPEKVSGTQNNIFYVFREFVKKQARSLIERLSIIKQIKIQMKNGTVKFFNNAKGFGFITVEGTGEEVFVHITGTKDEIRENDQVTFRLEEGRKGLNAVDVRLA
jgi:CspA family cold shock protein